jgi:osmotically-inducible protein OsmY
VSAADGKVTLSGVAGNGAVRNKAENVAKGIAGVIEIDNRIISITSR